MRAGKAALWLILAIGSAALYRVESGRQAAVERYAAEAALGDRNPVAAEVIRLARDPDHAAAAFARAAAIDAIVLSRGAAAASASKAVLERSITAYLTPDRHPRGSYGEELLSNQQLLARSHEVDSPRADPRTAARELRAARDLALDGLRLRPGFQDHIHTLRTLDQLDDPAGGR